MILGVALLLVGCARKQVRIPITAADSGKSKFDAYCSGCHVDDAVTSGPAPTLEGSTWVTGPEGRTIRIVLHGVGGPIDVAIISRIDGFVWVYRKHYFEPSLNPRYFHRKFGTKHA